MINKLPTKLTMVSTWFRGCRKTIFIHLPIGEDGKVLVDGKTINQMLPYVSRRGETFSIGG